ncbi:hypothetical protein LZ31DRAFT_558446 [Colletotrichum somersetense]|nr:hypothetical protein LZ31DRAFT_558446 [Colletotrichum somersetense]
MPRTFLSVEFCLTCIRTATWKLFLPPLIRGLSPILRKNKKRQNTAAAVLGLRGSGSAGFSPSATIRCLQFQPLLTGKEEEEGVKKGPFKV